MAAIADIDRSYYSSIEQGRANPTFEMLWTLVSAFEITWEAFGRELDGYPIMRQRPLTRSEIPAHRTRKSRSGS